MEQDDVIIQENLSGGLEDHSPGIQQEISAVYPNAEVRVSRAQYSILHIKRLVEDRKELILAPDFQRDNIWTKKQGSELVESILMGIPIPVMYLFETRDGRKQVVDGRQRISAICDFLNDKLVLKDLKILSNYNNLKFSQLDPKMQGIFEDFQMSFYIIQPPTPERVKYDIFDRVNRGGTQLTNQEMRNALYIGKSTELIAELGNSNEFLRATGRGISPKRKRDQYVVLRAISFDLILSKAKIIEEQNGEPIEYKSDIDDFLAKMMIFLNEKASDELIADCKSNFIKTMDKTYDIMGEDAFRFSEYVDDDGKSRRRPINMPLFEVLYYVFSDDCVMVNPATTRIIINDAKKDLDHRFVSNVDSSTQVYERYSISMSLVNQIKNDTANHNQ